MTPSQIYEEGSASEDPSTEAGSKKKIIADNKRKEKFKAKLNAAAGISDEDAIKKLPKDLMK